MFDDKDFQDEIKSHLDIAARERMADGADEKSARQASLKDFGNVTLTREAAHSVWTPRWVEAAHEYLKDTRHAIRALAKNPVFSLTVVGVLTLGIGLNAAVFTMVKGIALTPLSGVDDAVRLHVVLGETNTGRGLRVSYPDYQYLRDHDAAFSDLMGNSLVTVSLGRGPRARQISVEMVTGNYFRVLGVTAARGRTILPSDELAPGKHPVIVLSDVLWRREFDADPDMVGRTVEINNVALTVVGVAEPAFHGTIVSYDIEAFVPIMMAGQVLTDLTSADLTPSTFLTDHRAPVLYPLAYLRPGVTLESARAQTAATWAQLAEGRPSTETVQALKVVPFMEFPGTAQATVLPMLMVLSGMGLLVLLIACANIAGLVLVRGVSRRGEIAVRLALGASRRRIVRLLMIENLVLAVPGAVLGMVLARRAMPALIRIAEQMAAPQRLFFNLEIDPLVIGFAAAVACLCAVVFGVVPALQSSRVDLAKVMNEDSSPRGAGRGRLRAGLVVAQVAVSLLLLVGAGLATRTVEAARQADPGFDPHQVTAVSVDVRQNRYDSSRGLLFYRRLLDAARHDGGIEFATLAAFPPMGFLDTPSRRVSIEGYEPRRDEDLSFMWNAIGPDYFRTLKVDVAAGREFEDRDDEDAEPVVIVNSTLAARFWGGTAEAIGKRVRVADGAWRTVVGVAADVKYSRINEAPRGYVYLPFFQSYRPIMMLHTRGTAPIATLLDRARAQVASLDPELPIVSARPMTERISGALLFYNFTAMMLFIFGTAGMALAALGTYGLVSYAVKQSTHEIGIRMALGAPRLAVVRAFFGRGLKLGAVGAALGIVGALAAGRLLGSLLFGVSATDVVSFARALAIVLGVVGIATVVPAWRAARTNPLKALRHQ